MEKVHKRVEILPIEEISAMGAVCRSSGNGGSASMVACAMSMECVSKPWKQED